MKVLKSETITKKVKMMNNAVNGLKRDINNHHVQIKNGNTKTGPLYKTFSLMPILDCINCGKCMPYCYDMKDVYRFGDDVEKNSVLKSRAINSLIHKYDKKRYWKEIENEIFKNCKFGETVRLNVGGDLDYEDMFYVNEVAKNVSSIGVYLHFFTKSYNELNSFLDKEDFNYNVVYLWSLEYGMDKDDRNYHEVPMAKICETDTDFENCVPCEGNCSYCKVHRLGCYKVKKGETLGLNAH